MVPQSLSDCVCKRSQVKRAVPETVFLYQTYSFWLTALILVLLFQTFPAHFRLTQRETVYLLRKIQ